MAEMNKTAGAPTGAPAPAGAPAGGMIPRRDLKPVMDEIDAILADAGIPAGGPGGPETGMAPAASRSPEGMEPGTGTSAPNETAVIADVLGVSAEKAQMLFDAAQMMPKLAGKSAAEIADMLSKDMNLRMQLEKNLGAGEDMMARKEMAKEGMMAPPPMPTEPSMGKK